MAKLTRHHYECLLVDCLCSGWQVVPLPFLLPKKGTHVSRAWLLEHYEGLQRLAAYVDEVNWAAKLKKQNTGR